MGGLSCDLRGATTARRFLPITKKEIFIATLSEVVTRYNRICYGSPKGTLSIFSASATLTFQKTDLRDIALEPIPVRTRDAKILIEKKRSGSSLS